VSAIKPCSFYRELKSLGIGRGIGQCDLDGDQMVCDGDLNFCKKSSDPKNYLNIQEGNGKDRRKYPRIVLDLPLEYRVMNVPNAYGGLVVNVSEMGLLIESVKDIPVGTKLNIAVLFPKEFELTNFEVLAEVVRKEMYLKEDWEGYQCGLKFISIREDDNCKLRQLLCGQFNLDEI
jgi:c-di-GMP-binding flagellar brake protein YcgR